MKSNKVKEALAAMPSLRHYPRKPEPFDILDSEIVQWIGRNRVIMSWFFDTARQSKMIAFDAQSECWKGVGKCTKNQTKKERK